MPFYIILIIFISIVFIKLKKTCSIDIMKMTLWISISYSFLIITHLFSGISYNTGSIIRIFPYFLLCIILLIVGEMLGKEVKTKSDKKLLKIKITNLAYISIFGSILLIIDIIRLNEINFGTRIDDFQVSIIGVVGNILSSIGIIAWLMGLYENRINSKKIPILAYFSILSYVSGGIISAGRQSILLITFSSIILFLWSYKRKAELKIVPELNKETKKNTWGIKIVLSIFISYFFFISFIRAGIFNIDNKMDMLESFFNAKISIETRKDVYQLGPISDIYIESLFYYSHELKHLDLMYQNYDYHPLFGLSQLTYVERRVQWLFGKQGDNSWKKIEIALEQKGHFSPHTWGTFITNYILDFGRFGALIACFITGIIIGILYRNLRDNITPQKIVRHCILLAGVVFSIQFSPLCELTWTFPLIFSSFIKPYSEEESTLQNQKNDLIS